MRSLLELEAFATISDNLQAIAKSIDKSEHLTLLVPPSPTGAAASAQLEAALLDSEIPYRRQFTPREASPPCIEITEGEAKDGPVPFSNESMNAKLSPMFAIGVRGHDGAAHRGVLSPVAQAAALAELISPDGKRLRKIRPWLLAGNWWASGLDQGYDPIYSALRDHLKEEGGVRILPLPEVDNPDMTRLSKIDSERDTTTREAWPAMDLDDKANALSTLILPQVVSENPSTARLEELIWHRVKISSSGKDLHSSMVAARSMWDGSPKSTADLVDAIVSDSI